MRIRSRLLALGVAGFALLGCGCATVLSGPNQRIEVLTEPPGATVTVDGDGQRITSPGVLKLPRKEEATVSIELAGYKTRTVKLVRKDNGVVWLDLVGVAGGIVAGAAAAAAASTPESSSTSISSEAAAVVGGLIGGAGFILDFSNGAAFRLDPSRIVVTLLPAEGP